MTEVMQKDDTKATVIFMYKMTDKELEKHYRLVM